MTTPQPEEPMMDVARGDQALSQHLRRSLQLLRDKSTDDDFRRLANDILQGRAGLREAFFSPSFQDAIAPHMQQATQWYEDLSESERAELAAEGERQFAEEQARIDREG